MGPGGIKWEIKVAGKETGQPTSLCRWPWISVLSIDHNEKHGSGTRDVVAFKSCLHADKYVCIPAVIVQARLLRLLTAYTVSECLTTTFCTRDCPELVYGTYFSLLLLSGGIE